ncbi:MAG: lipopolysaccharide assembly protein LapB [Halioglobus sp.]
MNDLLVFLLLFVAIAIGWWLGRRSADSAGVAASSGQSGQYYQGLNYLLDGRPDGATDAFIEGLEVNSETLETHLALGNLLRKRGEVDRAIRVHQNLLARPSLPRKQVHQAHLELARDYISAGLLDRAERLLLDLVEESAEQRVTSRRYLLDIYQSERDWQRAIEVATDLLPRKSLLGNSSGSEGTEKGQSVALALAHYRCEIAADKLAAGELQAARSLLQQALAQDKACVRASIMLGEVEYEAGHYREAVKALRRVKQQDADYLPETVAILRKCYQQMNDEQSLKDYLEDCLDASSSPNLLLAVAEDICDAGGKESAAEFLSSRLADQPSLRGLAKLINLQLDVTEGDAGNSLGLLQVLVERLISERPTYRCAHCGFSGRQLHWFCPGCKYWGTMKAIQSGGE